ncbi:hypothetical protein MAR_027248 [Mya arenaria]|uniref:Uncharacterized protein n=1 Tax=Mya arenaria TaxID=6604 RepID=A0ABY7ESX5_MYAAR|nr:hypothetical protein MAR_027248 [Mya arenaria]
MKQQTKIYLLPRKSKIENKTAKPGKIKGEVQEKKDTTEEPGTNNGKAHKLYQIMILNIRKWYKRTNSMRDRRKLANFICSKQILKRYGLGAFCSTTLGISRRHMKLKDRKTRVASIRRLNLKEKVKLFLERDDNSRLKADKQATLTKNGVKKQVRLLSHDLKTLHKKLHLEGSKISYSLLCKLRPFWIIKPTEKDHKTCLCKIHENLAFKVSSSHNADMIKTNDPNVLMKTIVCDTDSKACMYRDCKDCGSRKLNLNVEGGEQLTWNEWRNRRVERERSGTSKIVSLTVKEKKQGTKQTLGEELDQELQRACRHYFNIRHQY